MGSAPTGEAGQQGTRSSIQCGSNAERVGPCLYPLPIHAEQAGRVASQDRRLLLVGETFGGTDMIDRMLLPGDGMVAGPALSLLS
jgi:hypothetical protein